MVCVYFIQAETVVELFEGELEDRLLFEDEFESLRGVDPLRFDEDEDDSSEVGVKEVNCCDTTAAAIANE